ncbi:MAG: hypothetical protein M9894_29230 [Planctomycetes bacterium]|nr:hypothetical protein [Planctomycetota bacterium]
MRRARAGRWVAACALLAGGCTTVGPWRPGPPTLAGTTRERTGHYRATLSLEASGDGGPSLRMVLREKEVTRREYVETEQATESRTEAASASSVALFALFGWWNPFYWLIALGDGELSFLHSQETTVTREVGRRTESEDAWVLPRAPLRVRLHVEGTDLAKRVGVTSGGAVVSVQDWVHGAAHLGAVEVTAEVEGATATEGAVTLDLAALRREQAQATQARADAARADASRREQLAREERERLRREEEARRGRAARILALEAELEALGAQDAPGRLARLAELATLLEEGRVAKSHASYRADLRAAALHHEAAAALAADLGDFEAITRHLDAHGRLLTEVAR